MSLTGRVFTVEIEIFDPVQKRIAKLAHWLEKTCGLRHKKRTKKNALHYTAIVKFTSAHYSLDKQIEFWISASAWKLWELNNEYAELHFTFRDITSQLKQANKVNLTAKLDASPGTEET